MQQLRTQLAELQQRVRQAADSEAGLQAQLADARQEKDDAKRQADDARRQADDVRQRGDGAKDTQAQLEAAQQKQRQQADTIVQQRDLIRQLRDKVGGPRTICAAPVNTALVIKIARHYGIRLNMCVRRPRPQWCLSQQARQGTEAHRL